MEKSRHGSKAQGCSRRDFLQSDEKPSGGPLGPALQQGFPSGSFLRTSGLQERKVKSSFFFSKV